MRVALISEHASPLAQPGGPDHGGQNTHVAALAVSLAEAGHEVRVYTRRDNPHAPDLVQMHPGVAVAHVPAGPAARLPKDELLPFMGAFGRWLADEWTGGWRPDVAHAHFWMSGLAALTARARAGVPVVQTFHALGTVKRRFQGDADTSPPGRIGYERVLGRQVDRVIAQCRDEVEELCGMGVPRSAMTIIPSGVDSARFTPQGRCAPREDGLSRLLVAGRLVPRKGLGDLIRAMPRIPDAELVLVGGPADRPVGEDPEAARLLTAAQRLGVADRVRFPGAVPVEEMPAWYRSADVVVCPGWYEPFGLTALEAMACGVPVVANAVGGYLDTVVDGVTGALVRPRDVTALADTLRRLLSDPLQLAQLGAAGADRARSAYTWTRTAERLASVYQDVTASVRPASPALADQEAS
jgi:D-inositol-3-phosphate glycosyltransferase